MSLKSLSLAIALAVAMPAFSQGEPDDLRAIFKLAKNGEYAEALAAHQAFFEESRQASAMTGVRLSYAIGHWAELGKVYPPAQKALESLRLSLAEKLKAGKGDFETMSEFDAINELLGLRAESVEMFRYADQHYPEKARRYYFAVKDPLLDAGEYQLVLDYMGDPIYAYENARNRREHTMSRIRQGKSTDRAYADRSYHDEVQELLALTRHLNMDDVAEQIQRRHEQYMILEQPQP